MGLALEQKEERSSLAPPKEKIHASIENTKKKETRKRKKGE